MVSNVSVSEEKINIRHFLPLSSLSWLRTGGMSAEAAFPRTAEEAALLISYAEKKQIPFRVVGGLSNTLVPDEGFEGLLIIMTEMKGITIHEDTITAASGEPLSAVIRKSFTSSLEGMEHFTGIPGTIGGAVAVNAGSCGFSISDYLLHADIITKDGKTKRITKDDGFSYRTSPVREDEVITSVTLKLRKTDDIWKVKSSFNALLKKRTLSGQYRYPSLGCVFRNPEGDTAGRIIDSLGLKGMRCGDALVWENHANFIVNTGGATSAEYLTLARKVKKTVFEKTGINLEYEVRFLGK
ncbi:MAG: UDP-N-acetylmuramate dehydrogenase [Bullifex sp.]